MNAVAPIFIVGSSRSGTTLVRTILNRHSRLNVSNETHYFDDLRPRLSNPSAALGADERPIVLDYFAKLAETDYVLSASVAESRPSAPEPASYAADATADQIFASHCFEECRAAGKIVWGEKTPRHLYRIDEILEAFPNARIIALIRDPRGVVASYRDWGASWREHHARTGVAGAAVDREADRLRQSYNLTLIALLWRSAMNRSLQLQAALGPSRLCLVRFEDVLQAPAQTIERLSDWLGVAFEPEMLNISVINSSFSNRIGGGGVDATAADRWREALSADEIGYVEWLCGALACELGYPASGTRPGPGFLVAEMAKAPLAALRAAAVNKRRIGDLGAFVAARLSGLFRGRRSGQLDGRI